MFIRGLTLIGLAILIFVLCVAFLHFDFLSSGLWWTLFFLLGISEFVAVFGRSGHGTLSLTLNLFGNIAAFITVILSFIFFWWQGGVGMVVAWLIWMMFLIPIVGLVFMFMNSLGRSSH
jgi:F0F1-type ATP synthase membrane subunit a